MAAANGQGSGFGANSWLVEEMYEQFVHDPNSVSDSWQEFFADYRSQTPAARRGRRRLAPHPRDRRRPRLGASGRRPSPHRCPPPPRRRPRPATGAAARRARTRTGQADPWRRRGHRRQHGTQPRGPHRHQLPQRAGQAARGQPQGDQRVPRAHGADEGQLHPPDRLRHRPRHRRRGAGDEEHVPRGCRRQAAPRRQRARQHGPRRRRVEGRRQPHARRARGPRRRHARLRRLPHRVRGDHPQGQEQQARPSRTSRAPTCRSPTPARSARSSRSRD